MYIRIFTFALLSTVLLTSYENSAFAGKKKADLLSPTTVGSQSQPKRRKLQDTQQEHERLFCLYGFDEFLDLLSPPENGEKFQEQFELFQRLFTSKNHGTEALLEFTDSKGGISDLLLTVDERGPFYSEITDENELVRFFNLKQPQGYASITLREGQADVAREQWPYLMKIRIDNLGQVGELVTVKKGTRISGTQIQVLSSKIRDFLQPSAFLVHDEAKIELPLLPPKGLKNEEVLLRRFYPLISKDGSGSWYKGYQPLNFIKMKSMSKDKLLEKQHAEIYTAAALKLRNIKLSILVHSVFAGKDEGQRRKFLLKLIEVYFERELEKVSAKKLSQKVSEIDFTLGELIERIMNASKLGSFRGVKSVRELLEIQKDLKNLHSNLFEFKNLFTHWASPRASDFELRSYALATRVIHWHCIWAKFSDDFNLQMAEESILKPSITRELHKQGDLTEESFDHMLKLLDKNNIKTQKGSPIEYWEDLAPHVFTNDQDMDVI